METTYDVIFGHYQRGESQETFETYLGAKMLFDHLKKDNYDFVMLRRIITDEEDLENVEIDIIENIQR